MGHSVVTRVLSVFAMLLSVAAMTGCATPPALMPTPNVYAQAGGYAQATIPPALKSNRVDLLYVTDRSPVADEQGDLGYGSGRSASLAYGAVVVEIGDAVSWEQLVQASGSSQRAQALPLFVRSRIELGQFPPTPHAFSVVDGMIVEDPVTTKEHERVAATFRNEIARRLAFTERKEVLVYVHGYDVSFDEAAADLADIWHFVERRGIPIVYTWPAAHGGLFGYFADRESGEFTIFHLKQFLRLLASIPQIDGINIIAHSRGTDVATTALRELIIEYRAAGRNPRASLRIENLILAAPDIDFDIVRQRLMAEKFGPAFGQITVYTTDADAALDLSETLMTGTRFGRVRESDLGAREQAIFAQVTNVNFIDVQGVSTFSGHGYFLDNPAASSDVILILKDGARPGDPARPLTHKKLNFWELPAAYPGTVQ
jgi:esterase/lipase superfamily enzyme